MGMPGRRALQAQTGLQGPVQALVAQQAAEMQHTDGMKRRRRRGSPFHSLASQAISLDGFGAGPDQDINNPLGVALGVRFHAQVA